MKPLPVIWASLFITLNMDGPVCGGALKVTKLLVSAHVSFPVSDLVASG